MAKQNDGQQIRKDLEIRETFWEKFFIYPSFNLRFWVPIVGGFIIAFCVILFIINKLELKKDLNSLFAFLNIAIQSLLLVFAIYSLFIIYRQLVESRFEKLVTEGRTYIKSKNYVNAINCLKEALFIKEDNKIALELLELYLIIGNFLKFDESIKNYNIGGMLKKIISEPEDELILNYLLSTRYLLVENLGEAKNFIRQAIKIREEKLSKNHRPLWDFNDLRTSNIYQGLRGESRKILDNFLRYLENVLDEEQKEKFEKGNFSIS
jgi:tetratricopeptide (TPR) repeat protein